MKSATKFTPKTPRREKTILSSSSESSTNGDRKDPVQVFCRLRPLSEDLESCIKLLSPTTLILTSPNEARVARKDVQYIFKHIFTSFSPQKEIFDHVALPLIEDLLYGKNCLLFTYGVTGSGKTYTLTGDQNNPGIMPRCIDTLFNSIEGYQAPKYVIKSDRMNGFEVQTTRDAHQEQLYEIKNSRSKLGLRKVPSEPRLYANDGTKLSNIDQNDLYSVFVSYIEIYNNTVYDLLDESSGKVLQAKILREDAQKNMYVNGVIEVEVKSSSEAFELFHIGQRRKRMAHTALNSESSRSHCIFSIRVVKLEQVAHNSQGQPMIPDRNLLRVGQLNLVDLAGSERTNRTQNTGMRLKEASSINNSLMSLRVCLELLRENQMTGSHKLIPYRDSRLTLLFKNYFEGEGKVQMILCANPSIQDYEENLHVMKFAEMTQDVKVTRPETRYTPYKAKSRIIATPQSTRKEPNIPATPASTLSPKIPFLVVNIDNLEECAAGISRISKILRIRKQKAVPYYNEQVQKQRDFRKRLLSLNEDYIVNKAGLHSLKILLKKEKQRAQNLEIKIGDLETSNENWAIRNKENMDVIKSLQNRNNEKDLKLNQNILEKEKNKQKLAMHAEKMSQELDDKLRRQREHLQAAIIQKDRKIKKVRDILDDVEMRGERPLVETQTQTNLIDPETSQVDSRKSGPQKIGSTPRHRRSRSAGEVWLEHNAVRPVPLGTVLQPSMKRRKSVTKLSKASDVTNPKQNKYCLIAQETDTDGEMETKLYKGDIVPTCGGGAQVIFNDVERLRQESPN